MTEIETMIADYGNMKKELAKKVEQSLASMFTPMFEKYPEITGFAFLAYTPYFNDGDPCEYDVHDLCMHVTEVNDDEIKLIDPEEEIEPWEGFNSYSVSGTKYETDFTAINKQFKSIPNEIMQSAVGEGFIVITRKGVEVSDYDHD